MFFADWKLKQPKSPIVPAFSPSHSAPGACAQSSTTAKPRCRASAMIAVMSAGSPSRCATTTVLVRSVSSAAIDSTEITRVAGSMSAQRTVAPVRANGTAPATYVCAGTITSSPF
eukprot:COSAG04_NODE_42_length_32379_cov_41.656691_5_plen_115_part_00